MSRLRDALFLLFLLSFAVVEASVAQQRPERTIEEIKIEAIKRAENGMYPLIGLDPADVRGRSHRLRPKIKMSGPLPLWRLRTAI